eukprot:m.27525 g.27525  ORF g.27525 m.27525 type:complete len:159 (-) comp10263_c0_seq2:1357-1833(-)
MSSLLGPAAVLSSWYALFAASALAAHAQQPMAAASLCVLTWVTLYLGHHLAALQVEMTIVYAFATITQSLRLMDTLIPLLLSPSALNAPLQEQEQQSSASLATNTPANAAVRRRMPLTNTTATVPSSSCSSSYLPCLVLSQSRTHYHCFPSCSCSLCF